MARKKVREFAGKRLLKAAMQRLHGVDLPIRVAQVKAATDLAALQQPLGFGINAGLAWRF